MASDCNPPLEVQGSAQGSDPWNAHTRESEEERSTAWLSEGIEVLMARLPPRSEQPSSADFDFVIVGSGYGGAIAASEIARRKSGPSVCLLERGGEYLPGAFPSRFADLAGHIRFSTDQQSKARGRRDGLFDIRIGPDVSAVVANGLGGGSLINAGVMAMPVSSVFCESSWPKPIRDDATLRRQAAAMRRMLGAVPAPETQKKFAALRRLETDEFKRARITVADHSGFNQYDVYQEECIHCGDCATGCNHKAKTSLDVTLLVKAWRAGAQIYTGATVLKLEKAEGWWTLHIVHTTEHMRRRQLQPFKLRARNVILCAGTFGSTEILLRSATERLRFSSRLGRSFSANGDSLAVAYGTAHSVNAVADEQEAYACREVGPTITGIVDLRTGNPASDMVVEDLGIPGPLRRAFEEIFATANTLHDLEEADKKSYPDDLPPDDPNAVNPKVVEKCLPVAIIGRDSADGTLSLVCAKPKPGDASPEGDCEDLEGDGAIAVHWPGLRDDPLPERRHEKFAQLMGDGTAASLGGRMLPNPMWRLLPPAAAKVLGQARGATLTVHPLGGCPMGDDVTSGVVDHAGRVFDPACGPADKGHRYHSGLYVLDGSIVPTSLGINPSLTIATLAHRAVELLRREDWKEWYSTDKNGTDSAAAPRALPPRPIFRAPPPAGKPEETKFEFTEQMRGNLRLRGRGRLRWRKEYRVEVTLWFKAASTSDLAGPSPSPRRALVVDAQRSHLCIYRPGPWPVLPTSEGKPLLKARLCGELLLFNHEASSQCRRALRCAWAWFRNRGLRDVAQGLIDRLAGRQDPDSDASVWERFKLMWKLASRAADRRLLEYRLTVGELIQLDSTEFRKEDWDGQAIEGQKCLTYDRRANPWLQLMRARLTRFPCWSPSSTDDDVLEVHLPYFGWIGAPLLHFVEQENQPSALADLASLWAYIVRTLLPLHAWSLRKPDPPVDRAPRRLPGIIERDRVRIVPEVVELTVDDPLVDGTPVLARLTRYNGDPERRKRPVLMIHGYSASGTTFAHSALPCGGLAGFLCADRQRDAWVLDLRSSSGMPTATHGWAFEDMGCADIPIAIDHVFQAAGGRKIDIVAHCMGSAMLSMGLFGPCRTKGQDCVRKQVVEQSGDELCARIEHLVMSQVVPAGLVMAPSNLLRAYLLRYLKNYLRVDTYKFRPEQTAARGDEFLDRLLATVPYPIKGEFDLENPFWPPWTRTPWVGVRHRMDALFGATFKLANPSPPVLDHIDDFFGPISFQTLSQVIYFAENMVIADKTGDCCFIDRGKIKTRFQFPVLHIHGELNGLVAFETFQSAKEAFSDLGPLFQHKAYCGRGHQDCLIGYQAEEVFRDIDAFLDDKRVNNDGCEPLRQRERDQIWA